MTDFFCIITEFVEKRFMSGIRATFVALSLKLASQFDGSGSYPIG